MDSNKIWENKFQTFLLIGLFICLAGGSGSCTRPSSDSMKIIKTDSVYQVVLKGEDCLVFVPPELKGCGLPEIKINEKEHGWQHVQMKWNITKEVSQDELSIPFDLCFDPDFWWAPHLAPDQEYVIAQHVFRSPALIVRRATLTMAVVPDLAIAGKHPKNPWFMDYNALQNRFWLGVTETDIPEHVLFKKKPGMRFSPGIFELGFLIKAYHDLDPVKNPWSEVTHLLWEKWGQPLYEKGEPLSASLQDYIRRTYDWAFKGWSDFVWQEFDLNGTRVGAPQFIVNISQSPNYLGTWYQREFLSIWNQAWFSSLRSASGLFRYARSIKDNELLQKARMTKELALLAPMKDGIFPTVIRTDNKTIEIEGKEYQRPESWEHHYWTNSNRSPRDHSISSDWYHVLDCSWTALLMLRWYEELEQDPRLVQYARKYADRLLALQDPEGFFPGWLNPQTQMPGPVMNQTPETSLSVTFLMKLADMTGESKYRTTAINAMDAVLKEVVPHGRWEDYETYWSCCSWGRDEYLGKKIPRNAMHKQNTLSLFWTAEALLKCYQATHQNHYLEWGRRTLDELSMAQQVWQPPFIYVPALGGFGVMNADGEWNDSRETLFAELFLDYYKETAEPDLFQRGVSALKSGFIMMYCPENKEVKKMWEKVYPWFGPEDYGFTMENYGHGGRTTPEGEGMGVFTIYDWGNGAAAEAAMRILDHYGHVYIDRPRNLAFGIDKVQVRRTKTGWELVNECAEKRRIRIVYEDGTSKTVVLEDRIHLPENNKEL